MSDSTFPELLPKAETIIFLKQLARQFQRVHLSSDRATIALG